MGPAKGPYAVRHHGAAWAITKQGSRLVRWAAVEAISRNRGGTRLHHDHHRIADRHGRNVARVAAARKILTLVYYGLGDGEIRCLAETT